MILISKYFYSSGRHGEKNQFAHPCFGIFAMRFVHMDFFPLGCSYIWTERVMAEKSMHGWAESRV